ncbi:MAG: hypothetical protein U1D33_01220 [bacterium]|nr:hypothetical protein [bacterium]
MTTQFARKTGLNCVACHAAPPKLNAKGEAFLARGYRMSSETADGKPFKTIDPLPVAVWVTGRHEEQMDKGYGDTFVPKVELISGGPIGNAFSYFVEWRVVSLSAQPDGTLQDRGGRFEDAFINWDFANGHALRAGQFRALGQYDVSRRLSVSEPILMSGSLSGDPSSNTRIQSLGAFSPSGRSPGVAYTYQSMGGALPSDGLFHTMTLPWVGEFSLPLSTEAQEEASFELDPSLKGVFLETFYRLGVSSVGSHAFIDDDRWLFGGLGLFNIGDVYTTAGLGLDGGDNFPTRKRYSAEVEWLPSWFDRFRPGIGARAEHISEISNEPAVIPYMVLIGPNTFYTFVLQGEGRFQEGSNAVILDLSAVF